MEKKEKVYLTIGLFVLVASVGITYYIAEGDTAYYCEVENSVGLCFKLSKVNDAGSQTRCYYNEETPTKYNYCKSGWFVYEDPTVTGELIKVDDNLRVEKIDDKYYIYELKEIKTEQEIVEEKMMLNKRELKLLNEIEYLTQNKEEQIIQCVNYCDYLTKEDLKERQISVDICKADCELELEFYLDYLDQELIRNSDRINELEKMK